MTRKYALTKIDSGDYLLPSNDGEHLWRIARYVDGPSSGLDIPEDRRFWGIYTTSLLNETYGLLDRKVIDTDWAEGGWEMYDGGYEKRRDAIEAALNYG